MESKIFGIRARMLITNRQVHSDCNILIINVFFSLCTECLMLEDYDFQMYFKHAVVHKSQQYFLFCIHEVYIIRQKCLILKPENLFRHYKISSGCSWYLHLKGSFLCPFWNCTRLYSMVNICDSQSHWFSSLSIEIKRKSFFVYRRSLAGHVLWHMPGKHSRNNCKTTTNFPGKEENIKD